MDIYPSKSHGGATNCQLQLRGSHFTTADPDDAVHLALKGLIQKIRSLMAARR
jgi:hypothetical protein